MSRIAHTQPRQTARCPPRGRHGNATHVSATATFLSRSRRARSSMSSWMAPSMLCTLSHSWSSLATKDLPSRPSTSRRANTTWATPAPVPAGARSAPTTGHSGGTCPPHSPTASSAPGPSPGPRARSRCAGAPPSAPSGCTSTPRCSCCGRPPPRARRWPAGAWRCRCTATRRERGAVSAWLPSCALPQGGGSHRVLQPLDLVLGRGHLLDEDDDGLHGRHAGGQDQARVVAVHHDHDPDLIRWG